ncbi:hypothetical protein TSUD_140380 [Trifolium subterraneum]|uniref:Reverse transcriptase domain-containing protein n=1 Tax=Trifolium subterraneum TaxID=3900 RepID=A0A2Z6PW66_TRISU|nr:hypothetical protein TSUD_140380 [Trifolium subterraneum]
MGYDKRGLKQGDPLAPFLFLLVVEGFSSLMRKAVKLNLFKGFSIGRNPVVISHLQYADDTLCIGEASVNNLWTLKAILRGFELASGLKVNFWKSGLIGVNVNPTFLSMACTFLNCRLGSLPFKYLGLLIGANPKSLSTWEPLLDHLRNRLCSWRNKHISLGGRIVMINAVLNAIPIFYLSFLKMPSKVWKKVVRIQREFLWGGEVRGDKKINWNPAKASYWWKDICSLDVVVESKNWLVDSLERRVGNGISTSFWSTKWIGEAPLSVVFPRLFSLSNQKEGKVKDFGEFANERWNWSFACRRELFQREELLVAQLRVLLNPVTLSLEEDRWRWRPDPEGLFSVKSSYNILVEELRVEEELEDEIAWNLEARGLILADRPWECMGCVGNVEVALHLFLHCPSAMLVWYEIFRWLGLVLVVPPSLFLLFEMMWGYARNEKTRKGYLMIWHTTLWSIWKVRNNAIFGKGSFIPHLIVDDIKVLSWKWSLMRLKVSSCMFYEWSWDPGDCLLR